MKTNVPSAGFFAQEHRIGLRDMTSVISHLPPIRPTPPLKMAGKRAFARSGMSPSPQRTVFTCVVMKWAVVGLILARSIPRLERASLEAGDANERWKPCSILVYVPVMFHVTATGSESLLLSASAPGLAFCEHQY